MDSSGKTPNVRDANNSLASPFEENPILERARNRVMSRASDMNSLIIEKQMEKRMGINNISKQTEELVDAKEALNSTTEKKYVKYRRERLSSVLPSPLLSKPESPSLNTPNSPAFKIQRKLPQRNSQIDTPSPDSNKENSTLKSIVSKIHAPKENINENKNGDKSLNIDGMPRKNINIAEVLEIAQSIESNSLINFVSLEKWIPLHQLIKMGEKEFMFYPENVDMNQQKLILFKSRTPKDPEGEGFYVEDVIKFSSWNTNKMERRLAMLNQMEALHWFGRDFRLNIDDIPLSMAMARINENIPIQNSETENNSMTDVEMRKAFKNSSFRRVMDSPDGSYFMMMELQSIQITAHPLMSEEFKIAKSLETLFDLWMERKKSKLVEFLTNKLTSLKESFQALSKGAFAPSAEPFSADVPSKPLNSPFYNRHQERVDSKRSKILLDEEENKRLLLKEIYATRQLRDSEMKYDRLLEYKVLKTWNAVKKIRKNNLFSATKHLLSVKIKESNEKHDKEFLEKEIVDELDEIEEIIKYDYLHKKSIYNRKLQEWTKKHEIYESLRAQRKKDFEKKVAMPQAEFHEQDLRIKMDTISDDLENSISNSKIPQEASKTSNHKLLWFDDIFEDPMPIEPTEKTFDQDLKRKEITARLASCFKPIGAPVLSFSLSFDSMISETAQCPRQEQLRRREIESTHIYLRIFYNDKEITKTIAYPLNPISFTAKFTSAGHTITIGEHKKESIKNDQATTLIEIQVKEVPDSIRIDLYETGLGMISDNLVAEILVPIPAAADTINSLDREMMDIEFSGRNFSLKSGSENIENQNSADNTISNSDYWYSGTVKMICAWSVDESGRSLGPKKILGQNLKQAHPLDPLIRNGPAGLLNFSNLIDWISELKLDPNDPRNNEIMELKQLIYEIYTDSQTDFISLKEIWSSKTSFRLKMPSWLEKIIFGIGPDIDLENNKRFSMLSMRFNKKRASEIIPIVNSEIKESLNQQISEKSEDKINNENKKEYYERIGFIKRIRYHQLLNRAVNSIPPCVDDFVREERLPPPAPQTSFFDIIFPMYRPLNPTRTDRKTFAAVSPESCKIVIQVLRGFNLPKRTKQYDTQEISSNELVTRTYVEASFQKNRVRTAAREGNSPQWNETLTLDLNTPNNDFSPPSLLDADIGMDCLYLNLFDELIVDMLENEKDRDKITHHRRERNWLGSMTLPFSTIWERVKIDGIFHLKIPVLSLGYEKGISSFDSEAPSISGIIASGETLLHLFVTLDPPLVQPPKLKLKFQSDESNRLLEYSKSWIQSLEIYSRLVIATTIGIGGQTIFICRYIRPQKPPSTVDSIQKIARFVSMIPVIPNRTAFSADCIIWCSSDQVLDIGAADGIEHAILLCNYLLQLDLNAFVVLGRGIPDGIMSYVMVQDDKAVSFTSLPSLSEGENSKIADKKGSKLEKYIFFNPITGDMFSCSDAHIQLKEVGCVFNGNNIWANIQKNSDINRMDFRLSEASCWKPFFNSKFTKPDLKSVQRDTLTYKDFPDRFLLDLEGRIEREIIENFERWREGKVTRWNKLCSRAFKIVLPKLESDALEGIPASSTLQESHELASLRTVYSMVGFPLNLVYTDVNAIISTVFNTDIHSNSDKGVEFAVAVSCIGMNVLVYNGPGTSNGSVKHTLRMLKSLLSCNYDIIPVDHTVLNHASSHWIESTALLVIPGGRDIPYVQHISAVGISAIKDYVFNGGKYLGFCAGAYFASKDIDFSIDLHNIVKSTYASTSSSNSSSYRITGSRDLGFFPGSALGSVVPNFTYNSEEGAHAISIQVNSDSCSLFKNNDTFDVYANGAPYFKIQTEMKNVKVLAWYDCINNIQNPAIVQCKVGNGLSILSGPHVEYDSDNIQSIFELESKSQNNSEVEYLKKIIPKLILSNHQRMGLMKNILLNLGLTLNREKPSVCEKISPIFLMDLNPSSGFESDFLKTESGGNFVSDNIDKWRLVSLDNYLSNEESIPTDTINLINVKKIEMAKIPDNGRGLIISKYEKEWLLLNSKTYGENIYGRRIMFADTLNSTQTFLEKNILLLSSLHNGTVLVATTQTSGKGRGKNSWISQDGCLQFSLVVDHINPKNIVFIQYLFGLAVVEAVKSINGFSNFPIYLKWPNDIYGKFNGNLSKLGGIIVSSIFEAGKFRLVIGCGINVYNLQPTTSILQIAESLNLETVDLCREVILAKILNQFELRYSQIDTEDGFNLFFKEYHKVWLHSNQNVFINEARGMISAEIQGLDPESGYLKARISNSPEEILLQPDGNSFDMLKGLISRKC